MVGISLCMVVYNEEEVIDKPLRQISPYVDEVVVMDQSSTDSTREICYRYTDRIFVTPHTGYCEADRDKGLRLCRYEWVLVMDADELLEEEFLENMRWIIENYPQYDSFALKRRNYVDGLLLEFLYPDEQIRLVNRNSVYWTTGIDSGPTAERGLLLPYHILHYRSWQKVLTVNFERSRLFPERKPIYDHFLEKVKRELRLAGRDV